jgi:photosystem II stability/assembly factor-like uncharacterized protein
MLGTRKGLLLGTVLTSGLLLAGCTTGSSSIQFAVGADGTILASTDSGVTWTPQASHTGNDLNSVSFNGTKNGCAVGLASTVVVTTDGSTWTKVANVPKGNWRSVDTYQNVVISYTGPYPTNIVGTAVGDNGRIMTTADDCKTWTMQVSGTTNDLLGVAARYNGSGAAFAVGQHGTILHTTDGTAWTAQTSGTTHDLRGVAIDNLTTAYAVGEHGVILKTTDSGGTWTAQTSGVGTRLDSIVINGSDVYAVGEAGVILKTTDGGTTWTPQSSGTTRELRTVSSESGVTLVIGDHGTVLTTSNGGTTWTPQTSGTTKTLRGGVA